METIDRDDQAADDEHAAQQPAGGEPSPRRGRLLTIWIVVAAIVIIAAAIWILVTTAKPNQAAVPASRTTATVIRTDLEVTDSFDGTLGYGTGASIVARASQGDVRSVASRSNGTITWLAPVGSTVAEGRPLFAVDGKPVAILYGATPAYRTLSTRSDDGPDIEQLERALVDLGYDPDGEVTVDETFTSNTKAMVESWQEDVGAEVDGIVDTGEVVFTDGPLFVADHLVAVGDTVGQGTPVVARSATPTGTITSIAAEGTIVHPGEVLYRVDDIPVVLLAGSLPAYRTLQLGTSGADVTQLQVALATVADAQDLQATGVYDEATRRTVVAWQRSIAAPEDGVVDLGDVVFATDALRVGSVERDVGDSIQDGAVVLTTSAADTFISVQLPASDQELLAAGTAVDVELPDGTDARATVTEVGSVAQSGQNDNTFFDVTIVLDDPSVAFGLDEAPVTVSVVTDSATGVLAVPVSALIALAEGGYAVEVVDFTDSVAATSPSTTTQLVGVDPGIFADGLVEVTSNGLQPGMEVVIP